MENKVDKDTAGVEFERFINAMNLDANPAAMNAEDKEGFEENRDRFIGAVMLGSLTVNENGEPTYTPQRVNDANAITFYEPTGASLMAMDRKKAGHDISKMFATMGDITKTSSGLFSKMKMSDLKICMSITTLFLG
jgi:hypothetical protein